MLTYSRGLSKNTPDQIFSLRNAHSCPPRTDIYAYESMPSVYQIFLIDFDLFGEEGKAGGRKFFHRVMMRLDDGAVLSDRMQILFFDLKVPGQVDGSLQRAAASLTGSQ